MSIEFLDRLEADLRAAAERRGEPSPRRPRPRPGAVLKALAVAAVLALLVVGGARLANRDAAERPAKPTPTPGKRSFTGANVAVATSGDPRLLRLAAKKLLAADFTFIGAGHGPSRADRSLGSVVLYREGESALAKLVARKAQIEEIGPIMPAEEARIHFDVSDARVIAVLDRDDLPVREPCLAAGRVTGGALRVCPSFHDGSDVTGFLVDGRPLPVKPVWAVTDVGRWIWAAASPDGKTILAQWSAECEVPQAYLIDAEGSQPRPLAPEYAESVAYGWTTDGRAIVFSPKAPGCGSEFKPGLYLVTADGRQRTRVAPARPRQPPALEPSLEPRTVAEVIAAAAP